MTRTSLLVLASLGFAAAAVAQTAPAWEVLGSWSFKGYIIEFRCAPPEGTNPPKCQHQAVKIPPTK